MSYLIAYPGEVAFRFGQHLVLTLSALAIALVVALPVGVFAARTKRVRGALFALFGVLYTVPSLAVLALLVPVVGLGFPAALIALVAYAQMILIRSVAVALDGVPAALRDAADGLGMSSAQRFWRVELPQALPVIVGGTRVATVALIAIANLAAWVDAGGLGTLIFDGLRRDVPGKVLAGGFASALLAISADALLQRLERIARKRAAA